MTRDVVLSAREAEILRHFCAGLSYRRTGLALGIAESTVKTHRNRLIRKLGVRDVPEAVAVVRDGEVRITVRDSQPP